MFELLIKVSSIVLPIFVFLTMFNVGLTEKVSNIMQYLRNRRFGILMLVANFILAPLLMWGMLNFFPLDPYLRTGLTIFSITSSTTTNLSS